MRANLLFILMLLSIATPLLAQNDQRLKVHSFNVNSQAIEEALSELASQAGCQLLFSYEVVSTQKSKQVVGRYDISTALDMLLEATPLSGRLTEHGVILITHDQKNSNRGDVNMNTKKNILATTIGFFMGAGFGSHALGQDDGGEEQGWVLEEIVVTATKREQNVKDIAMSVAAFSGDTLRERKIANFEDLGMSVPGLAVSDSGPGQRKIYMRGIGNAYGSSALVGIYMDEAPMSGNFGNALDLRTYDLERVEVLRGPQGTLFGQGSAGGAIRFITKKPQLDQFSIAADFTASFTKNGAPSQKLEGALNLPLSEDNFGVRVAGVFENSGGWIDQPAVKQEDINDQNVSNVRVSGLWLPSEALEVSAMVNIHRNAAGATSRAEDEDGNYTQALGFLTTPSTDDDYEIYNVTASYDFGEASLLSSSSYISTDKTVKQRGGTLPLGPPPAPRAGYVYHPIDLAIESYSQELRLTSTSDGVLKWLIGGYYEKYDADNHTSQVFGVPSPSGTGFDIVADVDAGSAETSKSWSVFANGSLQPTDWLEAGIGLRYFEDERSFKNLVDGSEKEETFDSFSPKVFVNVSVSDDAMVYASVGKGFRSGGFNIFGENRYDAEEILTYEIGTKFDVFQNRVSAEVALFYSEYKDVQINGITIFEGVPVTGISNSGNAEIEGVDSKVDWHISEDLRLELSGNYVVSEFDKIDATSSTHLVGDPLDFIPKYQFSLASIYDFYFSGAPATLRLEYNQQGPSTFRLRNVGSHFFSESDEINLLNFNLNWQWNEHVSLGVFAKNLLDDRGYVDAGSINDEASRSRPRTYGFTVGTQF